MEVHEGLTIAIAGLMVFLFLLRVALSIHRHLLTSVYRRILFHLVYPRIFASKHKTILNPTRAQGLFYALHIGVAVFCNTYKVQSLVTASVRAGQLAIGYLVPLIVINQVHWAASLLGIRLDTFKIFHKSVGTMVAIEASIHSAVALQGADWTKQDTIYGVLCCIMIALLTILAWPRRLVYELFLRSHLILTIALLPFLWKHLQSKGRLSLMLIEIGSICMAASMMLHWTLQGRANLTVTKAGVHMARVGKTEHYNGVTLLRIDLARRLSFRPGQYILVTLLTLLHGSIWQRHPFTVVWWETLKEKPRSQAVWVAIQERRGWTSKLAKTSEHLLPCPVWLQGPYGYGPDLSDYGNVLMFATGDDGIVVQLPLLKGLIEQYASNDVKTRKVKVVWQMKQWSNLLNVWLTELLESSSKSNGVENKELLDFSLHLTNEAKLSEAVKRKIEDYEVIATTKPRYDVAELGQRVRFIKNAPDVDQYLRQFLAIQSRRAAVIVSTHHRLCEAVRMQLLSQHATHVDFIPLEYQPSEKYSRHGGTAV